MVQIDRLLRIEAEDEAENSVLETLPGGWKNYFKLQLTLLQLLTEKPDGFTIMVHPTKVTNEATPPPADFLSKDI